MSAMVEAINHTGRVIMIEAIAERVENDAVFRA
jgi:hypothetical protein